MNVYVNKQLRKGNVAMSSVNFQYNEHENCLGSRSQLLFVHLRHYTPNNSTRRSIPQRYYPFPRNNNTHRTSVIWNRISFLKNCIRQSYSRSYRVKGMKLPTLLPLTVCNFFFWFSTEASQTF